MARVRFIGYKFLGNPLTGRHGRLSHGFRGFRADSGEIFGETWRLYRSPNSHHLRLGILGDGLGVLIHTVVRPPLFIGRKESLSLSPSLFVWGA